MLACLYQPASKSNVFNILFPKHKRIFRLNCVLLYTQTINVLKKSPEHLEINLWDLPRFFRWPYTVCFCNHTWSQVIL